MYYGIRINDRWLKEFIYFEKRNKDRYTGSTQLGNRLKYGDIVDIVTTELPERYEVNRSVGNTISVLLGIEKLEGKIIEIVPLKE